MSMATKVFPPVDLPLRKIKSAFGMMSFIYQSETPVATNSEGVCRQKRLFFGTSTGSPFALILLPEVIAPRRYQCGIGSVPRQYP